MSARFESEHARAQVERILGYAAIVGAAFLVSPEGGVVLAKGDLEGLDLEALAVRAAGHHLQRAEAGATPVDPDFLIDAVEGGSLHSALVGGHLFCVLARGSITPGAVTARLARARALLGRMLAPDTDAEAWRVWGPRRKREPPS